MRSFPVLLLIAVAVVGCDKPLAVRATSKLNAPIPPDDAGNGPRYAIGGSVTWKGEMPKAPELPAVFGKLAKFGPPVNAYFPVIDAETKGLANVAVYLKSADGLNSALPQRDLKLRAGENRLYFGESKSPVAATTVGSEVEMKPGLQKLALVRARGASFHTLTFPSPDTSHTRKFEKAGVVEFTNGSGDWFAHCRAYVFDHPWFAITDARGRFEIGNVLPGDYELAYEIADYRMEGYERDPDSLIMMRISFKEPLRRTAAVRIVRDVEKSLEVCERDFP